MIFKENMLFVLNNEKYRIVGSSLNNEEIFIINLKRGSYWNNVISRRILEDYFNNNIALEFKEVKNDLGYEHKHSQKTQEKYKLYSEIIAFLLKNSPKNEIFYTNLRKMIVDRAIFKYNVSESTIKRIFSRYLKNGKVISKLVNYNNCGAKGRERNNTYNNEDIVAVDNKFKKVFKEGINKYYNTAKKNNIRTTYELIMRDYIKENPEVKVPSLKQFYYWHKKIVNDDNRTSITKRRGDRVYQQTAKPIIGSSMQDTLAPADLYQIDSTILDVYIVSTLNRELIVGRPTFYAVIDTYSRLITGINVTIEPFNSYEGVRGALVNTFSNKVDYCKQYGIDIKEEEWEVSCIPNRILADRGELLSGNIENAITNLGIIIQNTPPYRGDMKGIVEKLFERIHSLIKPFVEGVVENKFNKVERGEIDYRLKANLTLQEITKIIIKCVLFHNNHHVLNYYESDGLDIEDSVAKIPNNIWQYGVKHKKGLVRELPKEVVMINLLPNKEVTVTPKGIRFNKLYYVSSYTLENDFFSKARLNGSFKVRISYNPNNLSEIYYIKEDGQSFDILHLVTHLGHYRGLSEQEVEKIAEYEKELNKKAEESELKAKLDLYSEIEEIAQKAKQEQEKNRDNSLSKSRRLKNIRGNLEQEREHFRSESVDIRDNYNKDNVLEEELSLFEKVAEDEWGDDYE